MLFEIENEDNIIYNGRDCSITYNGRKWYEMPSVKSLPVGFREIGRVGTYHFFLPMDVRAEVSTRYDGYFVRGDADV